MRRTSVFKSWKQKAKALKKEVYALSLAVKDPRVPWYAKVCALLIIGYVLSPIDPIPDFIPVIGLFDELIVVPLGIIILSKMIPKQVLKECREKARLHRGRMKGSLDSSINHNPHLAYSCLSQHKDYLSFLFLRESTYTMIGRNIGERKIGG